VPELARLAEHVAKESHYRRLRALNWRTCNLVSERGTWRANVGTEAAVSDEIAKFAASAGSYVMRAEIARRASESNFVIVRSAGARNSVYRRDVCRSDLSARAQSARVE
jgi:hypothetical protein